MPEKHDYKCRVCDKYHDTVRRAKRHNIQLERRNSDKNMTLDEYL